MRPSSPSGLATMRRVAVAVLLATGALTLLLALIGAQTEESRVGHLAIGSTLMLCGMAIGLARRTPPAAVQVVCFAGVGSVGVLVWLAEPLTAQPWLVLGPMLLLAGFFSLPVVATAVALAALALVTGTLLNPTTGLELGLITGALAATAVQTVVVASLGRIPDSPAEPAVAVARGPLTEPDLRARLEVLAEVAVVHGTPLALVLAGPRDRRDLSELHRVLLETSRDDDQLVLLDDAVGVVLQGASCAEVCGFAKRVATALVQPPPAGAGVPVGVGAAIVVDEPYPAGALLRRARQALTAAVESDGLSPVVLASPDALRSVDEVLASGVA